MMSACGTRDIPGLLFGALVTSQVCFCSTRDIPGLFFGSHCVNFFVFISRDVNIFHARYIFSGIPARPEGIVSIFDADDLAEIV